MLRGRKVATPKKKNDITLMASIHNRFDIEVVDAKTGEVKQRAKAENVILDNVWKHMNERWFSYIQYGSGQGVPSVADTTLFNYVGVASLGVATYDTSHYAEGYISCTKSTQLNETVAVGVTITEVGVARSSYTTIADNLMTHAMLQDMNGNPISILKTNTDIINLYATVFIHWDVEGYDGYIDIMPSTSLFSFAGDSISSLSLSALKGKGVGKVPWSASASLVYNATTRTFTFTAPRLTIAQGNDLGGFSYVSFGGMFIVKIPGPFSVRGEAVGTGNGVTKDFATAYDFPENAVVYVDGIPASNVTVSNEPIAYDNMGKYFYAIDESSTPNLLVYRQGSLPDSANYTGNYPSFGHGLFYNPFHDKWGIDSYTSQYMQSLEASNDLVNWEFVYERDQKIDKPISGFRNYKFWRWVRYPDTYSSPHWRSLRTNDLTGKNIHFAEPPAAGSVITIDYDTPDVPKDENHVFDCTLRVQLGAYSG